jgi:hypothetical protein
MSIVHTNKVLSKLEEIVSFRLGRDRSQKHPIKVQPNIPFAGQSGPATDGTEIFLPRKESHFTSARDNELSLANSTAHEADHIDEFYEYFGSEIEALQSQGKNLVQVYHERNHSDLTENPALAGWIDNIVKDRRIDANRREQLSGVKRHYEEVLAPAAEYFRPSIKGMSELDAFRELYLQKALIGRTVETIPEARREILEEVVAITNKSHSIYEDKESVERIYGLLKENFDITQPISRLPSLFGTGDHSQTKGSPQQGYGKPTKPREGREEDSSKPKKVSSGKNDDKKESGGSEDQRKPPIQPSKSGDDKDRDQLYQDAQNECGIRVYVAEPDFSSQVSEYETHLKYKFAGEIESMKRIFRQLQLKHYGNRRDFSGEELDFEPFMQDELESKVTGIKGQGRYFKANTQNAQRPAWAVLADISPSTDPSNYNLIEPIKASLLIQGESLGVTDYPFGLFAFSGDVYVVKDFTENYGPEISNKIVSVKRHNSGTYLGNSLRVVGSLLRRQKETPKGITIITDGESQNIDDAKDAINEMYDQRMHPFLIVIGGEFEKYAKHLTQDIGHEHYSIIERDRIHELPGEMFRLFKTYGISR